MRKLKSISSVILLLTLFIHVVKAQDASTNSGFSSYSVKRATQAVNVNDKWNEAAWKGVESVKIQNYMGEIPKFKPKAEAKMAYDDNFIYVIYRVKDRYVRSITQKINGKVWEDSAVEFFFSPEANNPVNYFNLEINCGGTPLLHHKKVRPSIDDIQKIEIAASLPKVVDPEITKRVTWTISFKIPLSMLEKYTNVVRPKAGVSWRANFYKIAEINSNKHYITWNEVKNPTPQFHLPQFFGVLNFQ
ncbi:Carbohydrate-binding family 9 [Daejeonella rubra]|uniref:Carbohydrate-binding family 9 n=1 Tax=Daejeonella rubra TaxID=990371 RepID=A0A1G9SWQ8_9SPHI|nr:carbohydrate-binding family 9-like protein [Daejeonella rubra]SDM39285.1 Carbohydrate-binding family 9 [Daejeonella rubra]